MRLGGWVAGRQAKPRQGLGLGGGGYGMCAGTFLLSCPPILRPSRASICKRAWDAGEFVNGIGIGETGNGGKEREAYRDGTESSLPPPRATASRHLTDTSACGIADPCCKAAAKKKKKVPQRVA